MYNTCVQRPHPLFRKSTLKRVDLWSLPFLKPKHAAVAFMQACKLKHARGVALICEESKAHFPAAARTLMGRSDAAGSMAPKMLPTVWRLTSRRPAAEPF